LIWQKRRKSCRARRNRNQFLRTTGRKASYLDSLEKLTTSGTHRIKMVLNLPIEMQHLNRLEVEKIKMGNRLKNIVRIMMGN